MAHKEQRDFFESVKVKFPQYFKDVKVIDIGALDINGCNRYLFENSKYLGVDVVAGKGVDIVSIAHEVSLPNESFDVVLSANALEHDMYYPQTLNKMVDLLKPNGLFLFSVSYLHPEHGTTRTSPTDSGTCKIRNKTWAAYFKNLSPDDIKQVLNLDTIFSSYDLTTFHHDTRLWGIKKDLTKP